MCKNKLIEIGAVWLLPCHVVTTAGRVESRPSPGSHSHRRAMNGTKMTSETDCVRAENSTCCCISAACTHMPASPLQNWAWRATQLILFYLFLHSSALKRRVDGGEEAPCLCFLFLKRIFCSLGGWATSRAASCYCVIIRSSLCSRMLRLPG